MRKIAVIGMVGNSAFMSVDEFHKGGETLKANEIHYELGGKGFNQAVAASRYGAEVSFLCAVGNQYYDDVREFLEHEGIKPYICQKNEQTAFATILTNADGDNQVTVYQGAQIEAEDVLLFSKEISNADILLLNNEVPSNVNVEAIRIAKQNGTTVVLNPAPYRELDVYIKNNVDYFTPNEFETKGIEDKDNLIVTLGSKGSYIKQLDKYMKSYKVENVVDTTGAGDTFNGVFCATLASGKSLEESVEQAMKFAAVSVTRKYAVGSIPRFDEVK